MCQQLCTDTNTSATDSSSQKPVLQQSTLLCAGLQLYPSVHVPNLHHSLVTCICLSLQERLWAAVPGALPRTAEVSSQVSNTLHVSLLFTMACAANVNRAHLVNTACT
mmetsp:Transcript_8972/g.19202  ORF Transcript_8972/g.19202 Transcript_8972/m.19202 type:complete len:108 (-) Transcript_8972:584-907(-)